MSDKITKILNELTYNWFKDKNKIIFVGEVWIGQINEVLNKEKIQYKWCYEKGKATYYIDNQE